VLQSTVLAAGIVASPGTVITTKIDVQCLKRELRTV